MNRILSSLSFLTLTAIAAHAGTYEGYYSTTGGNVGLDWSSDFGLDYSDSWHFDSYGPHAGSFNSFTERDFGGYFGIRYNSVRCTGTFPAVGTASPGHIHMVNDLIVQNYGGYGVAASSNNNGHAYTSGPACYWKVAWSLTYDCDKTGTISIDMFDPAAGWYKPADGVYPGGTRLSGTSSGNRPYAEGNFVSYVSLYQGQSTPGSGHLIYTVDITMSDAPIPDCPADFNNDGQVDDTDFSIFVVAYNLLDCADPAMPAGCPADINIDGVVDDSDFSKFVIAYNDLLCP